MTQPSFHPIAIVGRAVVLPGGIWTPDDLWNAVVERRDCTRAVPAGRWGLSPADALGPGPRAGGPDPDPDRSWSDRGGYVTDLDRNLDLSGVDLGALGLDEGAVRSSDPLLQLTLHTAARALADAGNPSSRDRAGLIMGNLSFPSEGLARLAERVWWGDAHANESKLPHPPPWDRFMSGIPALLAGRALHLGGPVFALDAACASALYAIKLACDRLQDGDADLMVAGSVNRADDLFIHVGFCALQAMSKTGRSRPFHADADGLVPAEGAGFVVLKRLEDAVAAGDTIHGVIRGIGLSNDGRGRGLLVPSKDGQARCMRAAWTEARLSPDSLGLLECHATGTVVGDATELDSCTEVLGHRTSALPIGSLKSNLGHLITAAGVAGLVKVLEAQRRGILPPTRHEGPLNATLDRVPLRPVLAPEPWTGSRRAAVNAFGFGGNNAHLIVEPHDPKAPAPIPPRPAWSPVAIVALGARVGSSGDTAGFADPSPDAAPALSTIDVDLAGLKFPPADLALTLGQQLAVLAAARDLTPYVTPVQNDRVGVFVGMGTDPEVARYGARWRTLAHAPRIGEAAVNTTKDAFIPKLQSAGVLGTMPNIPANRISSQLDLQGPGFTVSAEENSGWVALDIATRAVATGALDLAFAGAVDLSCEPVHERALAALRPDAGPSGDAAIVLALQRVDDARAAQHAILAYVGAPTSGNVAVANADDPNDAVRAVFGRAHAAYGLVRLGRAALDLARGAVQADGVAVQLTDLVGRASVRAISRADHTPVLSLADVSPRSLRLPARPHGRQPALPDLAPTRPAVAQSDFRPLPYVEQPIVPALTPDPSRVQAMPPAPTLPAVTALPPEPVAMAVPQVPPLVAAPAPASPAPALSAPATPAPGMAAAPDSVPGRWASALQQLGEMHRTFLADQAALHQRFLALRQHGATASLQFGLGSGLPAFAPADEPSWSPPPTMAPAAPVAPAVAPAPAPLPSPTPATVAAPVRPAAPAPAPIQAPAPIVSAPKASAPKAAVRPHGFAFTQKRTPTGLTLSREQLEIHASGKISEIYGTQFAPQDGFRRQCRMPEPPLLLADRVVGLDAEPASMGLGTIWTETDITEDAWYLHDGRIPAGVLIESGQADLMLISYLGIDLQHPGDRVYRLLGCTLTYHGDLPKVGETIRYDIHVDGHAKHGDVRLFFFHYDCFTTDPNGENGLGRPILSVRGGQAGFFTDAELADSAGILWRPEEQEIVATPKLDAPLVPVATRTYSQTEIEALAEGRPWDCFGEAFNAARPHVWTPRFQTERMLFLRGPAELNHSGGPWGRGYLKVTVPIEADEWYFDGHFLNDPCMPGTLMFEGCLQAMAFYLTSLGVTLKRDGWRFQPVPGVPFDLKCRGQVDPGTRRLTYEVFVEEFEAGPIPTLWADLLCTSDDRKAFHARRVGLQLVPDWPMSRMPVMAQRFPDVAPLLDPQFADKGEVARANGFPFGYHSLVSCAWGKPSDAFGPMYKPFDGGRHVARLPGEPYHFMTRVSRIDGEIGSFKPGQTIEIAYDVPPDVWYFSENDNPTMPFCVFLEAALQPCGWLACFVGSALTSDEAMYFRNLDGVGTMRAEIVPTAGTFRTITKLTNISRMGPMIIQSFDVQCLVGDTVVYDLKTVFGFFPAEALANQVGLPCTDVDRALLTEPCDVHIDLKPRPERFFGKALHLPDSRLCMIDRLTGWWPEGGSKGLGRLRAEKDVDPSEWYFKAHFYSDPVQPGSLGIEALIRLLQVGCMLKNLDEGMQNPRFEPLRIGEEMLWKYRGQVIPTNKLVTTTLDIVEEGTDERGRFLVAEGSLWVDGKRIYETRRMGMRVVDGGPTGPSSRATSDNEAPTSSDDEPPPAASDEDIALSAEGWLGDHKPTFTIPAVPMMVVADLLTHTVSDTVLAVRDVAVRGWLTVSDTRHLRRVSTETPAGTVVRLLDRETDAEVARGTVQTGNYPPAPAPWDVPAHLPPVADPYASGHLFHGPAFQVLERLRRGPGIAHGVLAVPPAGPAAVPTGRIAPVLLDGATHLVPHDDLRAWGANVPADTVAYPARLTELKFYRPTPTEGHVDVVVRLDGDMGGLPRLRIQWRVPAGVWAEGTLLEAPFPLGPIGSAPPLARRRFLANQAYDDAVRLSSIRGEETVLDIADIGRSDWLPGTIRALYGTDDPETLVRREHLSRATAWCGAGVHPGTLPASMPLLRQSVAVKRDGDRLRARTLDLGLDLNPVKDWWADWFGTRGWPTEDLYYGLIEKFVRHVFIPDPIGFGRAQGQPALFLGNHQTAVESLLFSIVASALIETPTVTVAKVEHKDTWVGHLIRHGFSWPGIRDPEVITYFDRDDKKSLMGVIGKLYHGLVSGKRSAMVHVEGTRSFDCTEPVRVMTGKFIDLAIEANRPIIPVKFSGGLPRTTLEARVEFAVGMGKQDLWFGTPIWPEDLKHMPYGARKNAVLDAINALGPSHTVEDALPPDPDFAARVAAWQDATGCSEEHATIWVCLQDIPEPTPQIRQLLDAVDAGGLHLSDSPEDRWLRVLARRLMGPTS